MLLVAWLSNNLSLKGNWCLPSEENQMQTVFTYLGSKVPITVDIEIVLMRKQT